MTLQIFWCRVNSESMRLVVSSNQISVLLHCRLLWRTRSINFPITWYYLLLWDIYISIWFTNTKINFSQVVSGDFIWFSFLNLFPRFFSFFGFSVVSHQWWSKVEGFRFAVTLKSSVEMFAVLLTETVMWQLVCVNLWEQTWMCFMGQCEREDKIILLSLFFFVEKKFVFFFFLYLHSILWHLCHWDL